MGKENTGNAVNLLCEGTMIVGDIKTKNDIRIDGTDAGRMKTNLGGKLSVSVELGEDPVEVSIQKC